MDIARGSSQEAVGELPLPRSHLFPGSRDESRAVPVPETGVAATARKATRIARPKAGGALADVAADGLQLEDPVDLVECELPGPAGEREDRPALPAPAGRRRDRDRHRLGAGTGERAAEQLGDWVRQVEVVQTVLVDELLG